MRELDRLEIRERRKADELGGEHPRGDRPRGLVAADCERLVRALEQVVERLRGTRRDRLGAVPDVDETAWERPELQLVALGVGRLDERGRVPLLCAREPGDPAFDPSKRPRIAETVVSQGYAGCGSISPYLPSRRR